MQDVTSGPDSTTGPTVHYAGFWARCFATILDTILQCIVIAPLLLGFIWVAFDRRKRGFHDMIAKTVVVHGE